MLQSTSRVELLVDINSRGVKILMNGRINRNESLQTVTLMHSKSIVLFLLFVCCMTCSCYGEEMNLTKASSTAEVIHYNPPTIFHTETGFIRIKSPGGRNVKRSRLGERTKILGSENPTGSNITLPPDETNDDLEYQIWSDPDNHCNCWNSTDGGVVREVECKCNGTMNELVSNLPHDVHRIVIKDGVNFSILKTNDLTAYRKSLREITLSDLPKFSDIENKSFHGMLKLDTIYILETPDLFKLSPGAFSGILPNLKIIRISHSSLSTVPDLSGLKISSPLEMLDLENNKIETITPGWIQGMEIAHLSLSYNKLKEIGAKAFEGSTIAKLTLKGNRELKTINSNAFEGINDLREIDLSQTSITYLPTHGLKHIEKLRLENVWTLRVIPSIYHFQDLKYAWLTFPYHCCAFEFPETHSPGEYAKYYEFKQRMAEIQCQNDGAPVINFSQGIETSDHEDGWIPEDPEILLKQKFRKRRHGPEFGPPFDPDLPASVLSAEIQKFEEKFESHHEDHTLHKDEFGTFHSETVTPSPPFFKHCGNVTIPKPPVVHCQPVPDAFSPCEDIMGNIWLRTAVWVVVSLALIGNTAVLVVLILAPGRMSVQRFLMANLSWADLCMGIYLLMVATEDLLSLGSYFNYAIDWQLGWGCQVAGFLTVFASELSVFTLAIITGERWYALTRAMHLNKRLTISKAAQLMSLGWVSAITLALLPLVGVSSYSKTSICLPMDATTPEAQGYLAFLLIFNGVAFSLVAIAYYQMYRSVAGHANASTAQSADASIAKKMGLLVFTDFACWAPVAFFGLTAVAGRPLIGVTDSKILLVFFYPLNACCNPYLYAILTKQYRRDLLLLLSRHGVCTKRAARFKTGQAGSTNNTMHTMQTILRLGSFAETKVTNGGRISVTSMGGQSLQSSPSTASSNLTSLNSKPGSRQGLHHDSNPQSFANLRSQKISVCSITSIPEQDYENEDSNNVDDGRLLAETTFISVPSTLSTNERQNKANRHVRISTATSPEMESLVFEPDSRPSTRADESRDMDQDITELTPFCSH